MIPERTKRQVAAFLLLTIWCSAGIAILRSLPPQSVVALPVEIAPAPATLLDRAAVESSATEILSHSAFRLDRAPARTRFLPWPVAEPLPAVQAPQTTRPTLTLVGVLSGAPMQVLVEGIPGFERGVLLRSGEAIAGFRLLRISGDTVVLEGMDTSWVFTQTRVRE